MGFRWEEWSQLLLFRTVLSAPPYSGLRAEVSWSVAAAAVAVAASASASASTASAAAAAAAAAAFTPHRTALFVLRYKGLLGKAGLYCANFPVEETTANWAEQNSPGLGCAGPGENSGSTEAGKEAGNDEGRQDADRRHPTAEQRTDGRTNEPTNGRPGPGRTCSGAGKGKEALLLAGCSLCLCSSWLAGWLAGWLDSEDGRRQPTVAERTTPDVGGSTPNGREQL